MRLPIATLLTLALVAACGTQSSPVPDATPSPIFTGGPTDNPAPTATLAPEPSVPSAEIEVLVTGGQFDGSYRAVAPNACENRPADNAFSVTYANDFAADQFVALNFQLRDATQAQEDATSNFLLQLSLGGPGDGVSYLIDPAGGVGEGDAYLDVTDGEATIDLSVITPDEALVDLTVICDLP